MQDTVDQAPATARILADIIAPSHLPSHPPSTRTSRSPSSIDVQDAVGVYDPDPEQAGDPADRIDTRRRQVMGSPAGL
jgi:hypothetical protein